MWKRLLVLIGLIAILSPSVSQAFVITWTPTGSSNNWYLTEIGGNSTNAVATPRQGNIYSTSDLGATWISRGNYQTWAASGASSDGQHFALGVYGGHIWTSSDAGVTWTQQLNSPSENWTSISISNDGSKILASHETSGSTTTSIARSSDFGVTWTSSSNITTLYACGITSVANSDNGNIAVATGGSYTCLGYIYISTDSGATWTSLGVSGKWKDSVVSSDGTKMAVAGAFANYIYVSNDAGATWNSRTGSGSRDWLAISGNSNLSTLIAAVSSGYIYTSRDFGVNWTQESDAGSRSWKSLSMSPNGLKSLAAAFNSDYLYKMVDSTPTSLTLTSSGTGELSYASFVNLATTSTADGKVTFFQNGVKIPGCISKQTTSFAATCTWQPKVHGGVKLTAKLILSDGQTVIFSNPLKVGVRQRSALR